MACCAMPGGCGRETCRLCTVIALLPQPNFKRHREDHDMLPEQLAAPEGFEPPPVAIVRPSAPQHAKPRRKPAAASQTGSLL